MKAKKSKPEKIKLIDACRIVKEEKQFAYISEISKQDEEDNSEKGLVLFSKDKFNGSTILDGTTANCFCAIYKELNENNKEKMDKLRFDKAISVAWKLMRG